MIVKTATNADVAFVLSRLRPHCRAELTAMRAGDDVASIARELDKCVPLSVARFALYADHWPAAILIAYRGSPAVAMLQTFSTEAWPQVALPFVHWFQRRVGPLLDRDSFRLAECFVLETPDFDRRWFALMGFQQQGEPLPRGRNGERYLHMVRLNPTIYGGRARVGSRVISFATRAAL